MTAIPLARNVGERQACAIAEIAAAEKINESYVGRVLRLTLLAPDIVEAILSGNQSPNLQFFDLLKRVSVVWAEQRFALSAPPKLAVQSRSSIDRASRPF
jgi:hypothetical protein